MLQFARRGAALALGCSAQDCFADLGLPSRISRASARGGARMGIHRSGGAAGGGGGPSGGGAPDGGGPGGAGAAAAEAAASQDYVYHYTALGMDILIDGLEHVSKTIVLHTNFPGCVGRHTSR